MAAAAALTEHVVATAGVDAARRVLDVGCGFGGTLDHIGPVTPAAGWPVASTSASCAGRRLAGEAGRRRSWPPTNALPVRSGTGPRAGGGVRVPLPQPQGVLPGGGGCWRRAGPWRPLSAPAGAGGMATFLAKAAELGPGDWYGHSSTPLPRPATSGWGGDRVRPAGRRGRHPARCRPTRPGAAYARPRAPTRVATIDRVEALATGGAWEYHVLAFRRRGS